MFSFGTHLKELRKSRGITQRQLAFDIDASERGIQQYELGERKPTYDMLIALADYFDVSLDYLVGRSDAPYDYEKDKDCRFKAIPWTFKTWIAKFKGVDLPIGDLATDIAKDPEFPDDDCFGKLLEHVEMASRDDPVIVETFVLAWNYYLSSAKSYGPNAHRVLR